MSDAYINIRIGSYHYKLLKNKPWFSREFSSYHAWESKEFFIAVYQFPGLNRFLNK